MHFLNLFTDTFSLDNATNKVHGTEVVICRDK